MILCLWFPSWPIQRHRVETNANRPNAGKNRDGESDSTASGEDLPLLLHTMQRGALRIVARCRLARQAGVTVGMPVAEAKTIVGDSIEACEHDGSRDVERLRELAVACRQFSPVCGLDAAEPFNNELPEGLVLDITGCGHLFGNNERLAERAIETLASVGYRAKSGVGETVGAAWAASRLCRDGVLSIPSGDSGDWLDRQPIGTLRLSRSVVDGLAEFDLRTVGQVRRLPREQLPSRFGDELLRRLDQADGKLPEPIVPILPTETPRVTWQTDDPLRRPNLLDIVLERLLCDLANKLPDSVGITKLAVTIAAESKRAEFDVSFARPTREAKRFVDLISLRMERLTIPSGIDRVTVEASGLDLITKTQTDLFGNPLAGETDRELSDLIEQLTGRLGPDRVSYARLTPDPLPERAVAWSPAIDGPPAASAPAPTLFTRPTTLLSQPEPVRVWAVGGRPSRVEHRGQSHDVANVWGPERIESGWWREDNQQRDYYRVAVSTGECLWLFRDATSGDWFLHGVF